MSKILLIKVYSYNYCGVNLLTVYKMYFFCIKKKQQLLSKIFKAKLFKATLFPPIHFLVELLQPTSAFWVILRKSPPGIRLKRCQECVKLHKKKDTVEFQKY